MQRDLGIVLLRLHRIGGRELITTGGYFTSLYWWPGLLWPGAWRYLANDNGKGELRCLGAPPR